MERNKNLLYNIVGFIIICFHLIPLYITFVASLKEKSDLSSKWFLPDYLYLDNFKYALADGGFFQALWNTILITFGSSFIVIIVGSMTAYVIARRKNWLVTIMYLITIGVMMIPTISLIVPLYNVMLTLNGINTYWGIIILISTQYLPISILIYSTFIKSIPVDLDESAEIDGCGKVTTFFRIILPQLGPVTASVIILNGVKMFNEFIYALYFLQTPEKRMITTYISSFFNETSNLNLASAAALLAILPVILVYLFLQKYFVEGSMDGMGK